MPVEMTAYVIEEYGDPDVFTETTLEVPEPGPDEIRVEVEASSLNPVDYKIRQGALPDFAPELPATLHCDVSGVVDAVGEDVETFAAGDEVYGMPGGAGRQGSLADYVVGHAGTFAHAPESIPLEEAAALPRSSRSPRGNCSPTRRAWMAARTCSSTAAAAASGTSPSNWPMRSARP